MVRRGLARLRIGTAGWSIPRSAATAFSAEGSHLERYAAVISAVEINSSFYRPHRRTTYERWSRSVPADFRFSVKLPKAISHEARLIGTDDLLDSFLGQCSGLGEKMAIVLLQLPPSFSFDKAVTTQFLTSLRSKLADTGDIACEPRHASWFTPMADTCLSEHRVARVIADPVLIPGGERPGGWPGLRYHRLHGAPRVYHSSYAESVLEGLAQTLAAERQEGATSWCIFDNTASGAASGDALALRAKVKAADA